MSYPSSSAAAKSERLGAVVFGIAAFNICLPEPNHSIERTYSSTLRVLPSAAHVKR